MLDNLRNEKRPPLPPYRHARTCPAAVRHEFADRVHDVE